jgi:hypothetical protein
MIAEEELNSNSPSSSIPKGTTVSYILKSIKESPNSFKVALTNPKIEKKLNEDELTQILVSQINTILIKRGSIIAQTQYHDVFEGTKGIPDIYFQELETGQFNEPLFIVEAKRLPTQPTAREKEYVIGTRKNGGIERFKIERHGKGLSECGIIGFIEKEDNDYWVKVINSWIGYLAETNEFWNNNEKVKKEENDTDWMYLKSIAHRTSSTDIQLHHFWINITSKNTEDSQ